MAALELVGNALYFDDKPVAIVIIPNGSLMERFEAAIEEADEARADVDKAIQKRLARLNHALKNTIGNAELTSR